MTAAELRDDYLLSIGCSIADKYTYIKDTGYKYFEKRDDGFITINGKNLPLNSSVCDTRALNALIATANNSVAGSISGEMQNKLSGSDTTAIVDVCSFALNCAKNYFADFFKYVFKYFAKDEATLKRLITLNDASLGALASAFDDVFKKHSINVSDAKADAADFHNRLNADTVASAAAAPRTTYGTTYYSNTFNTATTYASSYSSKSQAQIDAEMTSHSVVSRMWEETRIESANKNAITEINAAIDRVFGSFNASLKEIISVALPDFFNEAVNANSNNLEENPANEDALYNELAEISDSEFPEFKKVLDYYGISLTRTLNNSLGKVMCDRWLETGRCDYDSTRYRFYRFLTAKGDNFSVEQASIRCYNRLWDEINERVKGRYTYEYRKGMFDDIALKIKNCSYLSPELRAKIEARLKDAEEDWIDRKKKDKKRQIGQLVKSIVIALLICIGIAIVLASDLRSPAMRIALLIDLAAPFVYAAVKIISFCIKWRN